MKHHQTSLVQKAEEASRVAVAVAAVSIVIFISAQVTSILYKSIGSKHTGHFVQNETTPPISPQSGTLRSGSASLTSSKSSAATAATTTHRST